jgi:hypothetical protein
MALTTLPCATALACDDHVHRVSAKHGVKEDFAFLWEHAIFRHPPNKNLLTDRSEILTVDYFRETTKHAKNAWNR